MRMPSRIFVAVGLAIAAVSCGDVVRQGRSSGYLVVDSLQGAPGSNPASMGSPLLSDVLTMITSSPCSTEKPCPTTFNDVGEIKLSLAMKDIGTPANPTTGSTNNAVTINRYHVEYIRADGRNTPGVDVPYAFDGAVTGTVPAGSQLTLGFEIVRNIAKKEAPLVQLITATNVITTIARVTFYGRDQVGNDVSVTGSIQIDFANFGG